MGDNALLFAMLNLAGADAAINCWNDKYHFDFWRPWNAIPLGDTDGTDATEADPKWAPLLSAPYPEHPSGHLCLDGAQLRVLQMFFGDNVSFGVTSSRFGGETRFFNHFSDVLTEITEARIWAGLHYRTADIQGKQLGRNAGRQPLNAREGGCRAAATLPHERTGPSCRANHTRNRHVSPRRSRSCASSRRSSTRRSITSSASH